MRVLFALAAAAMLFTSLTPAQAEEWCGFLDKQGSHVRCGFSSLEECKQAVADKKDGYCMPDPGFAKNASPVRLAALKF